MSIALCATALGVVATARALGMRPRRQFAAGAWSQSCRSCSATSWRRGSIWRSRRCWRGCCGRRSACGGVPRGRCSPRPSRSSWLPSCWCRCSIVVASPPPRRAGRAGRRGPCRGWGRRDVPAVHRAVAHRRVAHVLVPPGPAVADRIAGVGLPARAARAGGHPASRRDDVRQPEPARRRPVGDRRDLDGAGIGRGHRGLHHA